MRDLLTRVQARVSRGREDIVRGRDIAEAIDIERLICPLRYDLCVRIDFIRLLRDEWPLYADDLAGFLERPQARAYYIWFKEVACVRYRPHLYRDERLIQPAFVQRVRETANLWQSILGKGYDPSTPIRLKAGRIVRSVNGKTINSAYFAGDGCHRMSCLYVAGHSQLQPEQYEVHVQQEFVPLDNTAILIKRLPLDRISYLHFISRFYCDGSQLDTAPRILQQVASAKPHLLSELESVFTCDLANWSTE